MCILFPCPTYLQSMKSQFTPSPLFSLNLKHNLDPMTSLLSIIFLLFPLLFSPFQLFSPIFCCFLLFPPVFLGYAAGAEREVRISTSCSGRSWEKKSYRTRRSQGKNVHRHVCELTRTYIHSLELTK